MTQESVFGAVGLAAIMGVVTLVKNAGMPHRLAPVLSLVLGILVAVGYRLSYPAAAGPWFDVVLQGILLGLGASGAHSGAMTMAKGSTVVRESDVQHNDVVVLPKGAVEAAAQQQERAVVGAPGVRGTTQDLERLLAGGRPLGSGLPSKRVDP